MRVFRVIRTVERCCVHDLRKIVRGRPPENSGWSRRLPWNCHASGGGGGTFPTHADFNRQARGAATGLTESCWPNMKLPSGRGIQPLQHPVEVSSIQRRARSKVSSANVKAQPSAGLGNPDELPTDGSARKCVRVQDEIDFAVEQQVEHVGVGDRLRTRKRQVRVGDVPKSRERPRHGIDNQIRIILRGAP